MGLVPSFLILLLSRAKAKTNAGFQLLNTRLKTTAYADDISVVGSTPSGLQATINGVKRTATILGLRLNANKCSSLTISNGRANSTGNLTISGVQIRALEEGEYEKYLGVPMGTKLTFRPATDLREKLIKVADSLLAPWQKLEVFRAHLLPSLSHHLATGRVQRGFLYELDTRCTEFLRQVAHVPHTAHTTFQFADRRAGGLNAAQLKKDADVWTIARAVQLLHSNDQVVRHTARAQLEKTVSKGVTQPSNSPLPFSDFLSGSTEGGLYDTRFYGCCPNTWTRMRKAARRLHARINVSSDSSPSKVIADDISCLSAKAARGAADGDQAPLDY